MSLHRINSTPAGVIDASLTFRPEVHTVLNSEPDPDWEFVDLAGHCHRWTLRGTAWEVSNSKVKGDRVATVCDHCGQPDGEEWRYELVCRDCGERISPKYRIMPGASAGGEDDAEVKIRFSDRTIAPLAGEEFEISRFLPDFEGRFLCTQYEEVQDETRIVALSSGPVDVKA